MFTAIKAFWGTVTGKATVIIGALLLATIVGLAVTVHNVTKERDAANVLVGTRTAERDEAIRTNASNKEAYDLHVRTLEDNARIAAAERDRALARGTQLERTIATIRASRPEERGPVSIIVQDTVARLWPQPEGEQP